MSYAIYEVLESEAVGQTLSTESGTSITLNSDGTISVSGAYASEDFSGASGGSNFTKVFAFGYGQVAGQRTDGSLVIIGYQSGNPAQTDHSSLLMERHTLELSCMRMAISNIPTIKAKHR